MGVRNTLADLNNILFEQLEKLNEDKMTKEVLDQELEKTKGMCEISKTIVATTSLSLNIQRFLVDHEGEIDKKTILGLKNE